MVWFPCDGESLGTTVKGERETKGRRVDEDVEEDGRREVKG